MDEPLEALAALHGVETSYLDNAGRRQIASPEALLRVLRVLGAPVEKRADISVALRQRRQERWQRPLEPVAVLWDGGPGSLLVRLPAGGSRVALHCHLELETGGLRNWSVVWQELPLCETAEVEGVAYETRQLDLAEPLPLGYHRLTVHLPDRPWECLLLSAPTHAYVPEENGRCEQTWGLFLPLYALHTRHSWGGGDFGDLAQLLDWTKKQGGAVVATLPLLAAFLNEPFEYSPYAPASRLFWNEFYLDVEGIPEWRRAPHAQALVSGADFQAEVRALRQEPLVDYRRQMVLKRRVLDELARLFFAEPADRLDAFRRFVREHPRVEDYARFRAVEERQRTSWWNWPAPLREGTIAAGDYHEEARRYHLYVQWQVDEQLRVLSARARGFGPGLYLDLPLGVHADSYDVWSERSSFALGIAGGAPPDPFFTGGQNWGFPPLHPQQLRETGYRYLSACIRRHLEYAGILRIDHMMGLHRLFWIPQGMSAHDGVYVRYPAAELYALFCLESQRHRSLLVGEDLGTVPPAVRPAMERHRVNRTFVVQYALDAESQGLQSIPPGAVASVNTHDMPTFAAFWQGLDLQDRRELGLLDDRTVDEESTKRRELRQMVAGSLRQQGFAGDCANAASVLRALLTLLCAGPGRVVLVNIEDLWQETDPQNMPGTWRERPNWRRKARFPFETWTELPDLVGALRDIDRQLRHPV